MRSFLRIGLVFLAIISVGALGYYAYTISTDTLRFPFIGQERQLGDTLRLVVAKPEFLSQDISKEVFDTSALVQSILKDGKPWNPTLSGESQLSVSGEYLEIRVRDNQKSTIRLDADIYNNTKVTPYKLPRSIELSSSDIPSELLISPVGLPRDRIFEVEMYGYAGLRSSDIRWYMHTDPQMNCDIADSWNSSVFRPLKAHLVSSENSSQIERSKYEIAYDTTLPRVCIIAGIQGRFFTVVDRKIDTFSATGSIVSQLSPEYDLQSEIEFRFSHDLFADSGALYSDEYIENRRQQKINFLKTLTISPEIQLTEENIVLTQNRASVIGDFTEGTDYTIGLRGVMDEYGRSINTRLNFTPISEPFLSIGIPSRRTMFRAGEQIDAKLYALKTPKNSYTMKLCRISLEGYARTERMITEGGRENIDAIYSLLENQGDTQDCTKKDITLSSGSVTTFRLQDMQEDGLLEPGLYILAPREKEVALSFSKITLPRVFSIVDTQITMKVDASGKMSFLATDINSGMPRPNQSIIIKKNILRTYTESWDNTIQKSIKTYLPFTNTAFSTGITLGSTSKDGLLDTQKEQLIPDEYSPPYGLMHEWYGDYEGQYQSFLATSQGEGHFGYVVSTWNDGITGWNFGMKDSDYSWDSRPPYATYIHTDRRLYLPGEKVYVHAIVRKNDSSLSIPRDKNFTIKVLDPLGSEIKNILLKPNDFGTLSFDFDIPKDAHLGSYSVQISLDSEGSVFIENGYTYFQVEVFKNPTFTANVVLKSDNIENDFVSNLRKKPNLDTLNPWYRDVYSSTFSINGIVNARYYNGTEMRGVPFTYRVYRSPYYDSSYWSDCFWGCYTDSTPEFYTEGTGTIGHDGVGIFRTDIDFSSFYNDYLYTVEVTITDPMTGESIVSPGTLLARMPAEYKAFDIYNPLVFTPQKKILSPGETLSGILSFEYGTWDKSLQSKYRYELIHREYTRRLVDDLRIRDMAITDARDVVMLSGSITSTGLSLSTQGLPAGEYHLKVSPHGEGNASDIPETSISDTVVYITGDFIDKNANLRVIPEKNIYHHGEKAKVLFTSPFTGGYMYITQERAGVISHEYVYMTGNTLTREYLIDDTFYPNMYLGAIAFASGYTYGNRNYAVGYGEIITDLSDKKANITLTPDKKVYKNREPVNLTIKMTDRKGDPLSGEVAVMLVDESLIRLIGNIDLDIIPKFFRKAPFTMKTALTFIGMEKNRFLSRKGSNGGSGDKGGGGIDISSRSIFRNTAYYNPTIYTGQDGVAKVSFTLPDNITDYRIIAIGQTQSSQFAVSQDTISVRKDYTIEPHSPYIAYSGDVLHIDSHVFNSTKKITSAILSVDIGTGSSTIKKEKTIILQALSDASIDMDFVVPGDWKGEVPYTVQLKEKGILLDSITKTITIPDIPLLGTITRESGYITGTQAILPLSPLTRSMDTSRSQVTLTLGRTPLTNPRASIDALLSYPYGCIEQTIASTIPNALALRYASILGESIDTKTAEKNLKEGVDKILRMQLYGGWKYWEDDTSNNPHVTPYVVRSLMELKSLGVDIPQTAIDAGIQNIVDNLEYQSISLEDPDYFAEVFSTLAQAGHEKAKTMIPKMEELRTGNMPDTQGDTSKSPSYKKLSRHGLIMYAWGLNSMGKVSKNLLDEVKKAVEKNDNDSYWYWSYDADMAIYARLLISMGDMGGAGKILSEIARNVDVYSYYTSTQTKIQVFLALIDFSKNLKGNLIPVSLRSDGLRADLSIAPYKLSTGITVSRSMFSDSIQLSSENTGTGVFYELVQSSIPIDILQSEPRSSGMSVSRVFEKIDESKGVDASGNWIISEAVSGNTFQKGKLYKVTITVKQPQGKGPKYYLTLEDFMSGGWRPIRGILATESQATTDNNDGGYWNGWSHVEARNDRILATSEYVWSSEPQTYTYYIRPEYSGKFLLPPVTAYYMYNPEIHAIGRYQQVQVLD